MERICVWERKYELWKIPWPLEEKAPSQVWRLRKLRVLKKIEEKEEHAM